MDYENDSTYDIMGQYSPCIALCVQLMLLMNEEEDARSSVIRLRNTRPAGSKNKGLLYGGYDAIDFQTSDPYGIHTGLINDVDYLANP